MLLPLNDRVIIRQTEQKGSGTFVIPEESASKEASGEVILSCSDIVKPGDTVYFNRFSGERVEADGKEFVILKATDLLAKYVS